MTQSSRQLVIDQVIEVQAQHPNLELVADPSGKLILHGAVGFRIEHGGCVVEDTYDIELHVADDHPQSPPIVFETGNKIPKDFEHFMAAGNLCLGAPVEVRRRFAQHRTLIHFINDQVIPYLFAYSFKRDHGKLPFDELAHGHTGLLQYYAGHFGTDPITAMKFLKCLADDLAPPASRCPCRSGRKLAECHGPKLDELRPHYPARMFEIELRELIDIARQTNIDLPERSVLPKRMWKNRRRRWSRNRKAGKNRH